MKLRVLPEARQEIMSVLEYYRAQSAHLKRMFADDLRQALQSILDEPKAWTPFGPSMRKRNLYQFKYGIVYELAPPYINVITFINLRGDPKQWRVQPE